MYCVRRNLNTNEEEEDIYELIQDNANIDSNTEEDIITVSPDMIHEFTSDITAVKRYLKRVQEIDIQVDFIQDVEDILDTDQLEENTPVARLLPYYQASTTCSGTGYATAPVYYTYYYYAGVNYYYYYCCPSGGSVSGSSCYYYYGATPVTYGQYECRAGGSLQSDGVTCLRNNC